MGQFQAMKTIEWNRRPCDVGHSTWLLIRKSLLYFVRRLAEVGKLCLPKVDEKYESGQFFLHRIFGYRGVVLFPWRVKVYDRNPYYPTFTSGTDHSEKSSDGRPIEAPPKDPPSSTAQQSGKDPSALDDAISSLSDDKKEVTVDVQTYYQVLIDARDCPHVV